MYCKNCGAELVDNAAFCVKCGTRVVPGESGAAVVPAGIKNKVKQDKKEGSGKPVLGVVIIAIMAAILLVLVLGIIWAAGSHSVSGSANKEPEAETVLNGVIEYMLYQDDKTLASEIGYARKANSYALSQIFGYHETSVADSFLKPEEGELIKAGFTQAEVPVDSLDKAVTALMKRVKYTTKVTEEKDDRVTIAVKLYGVDKQELTFAKQDARLQYMFSAANLSENGDPDHSKLIPLARRYVKDYAEGIGKLKLLSTPYEFEVVCQKRHLEIRTDIKQKPEDYVKKDVWLPGDMDALYKKLCEGVFCESVDRNEEDDDEVEVVYIPVEGTAPADAATKPGTASTDAAATVDNVSHIEETSGKSAESEDRWLRVYRDYYQENYSTMSASFSFVDLDDNDIPELLCDSGMIASGCILLACDAQGEIKEYWYPTEASFSYYPGKGAVYLSGGRMDNYYDDIYFFRDGSFEMAAGGKWGGLINDYHYYWNGQEVGEEEYSEKVNSQLRQYGCVPNEKVYPDYYPDIQSAYDAYCKNR